MPKYLFSFLLKRCWCRPCVIWFETCFFLICIITSSKMKTNPQKLMYPMHIMSMIHTWWETVIKQDKRIYTSVTLPNIICTRYIHIDILFRFIWYLYQTIFHFLIFNVCPTDNLMTQDTQLHASQSNTAVKDSNDQWAIELKCGQFVFGQNTPPHGVSWKVNH